jgi:DNA helicase IV
VCKLFENNDPIVFPYKVKYKYIFVDEFQDTDPKQWRFVSSFKNAGLFITGDKNQSIYRFRGADSSIIKALAKDPDWTTYRLEHNYRSTQEICKFANKISKSTSDDSSFIVMKSDVPGGMVKQIKQNPERYIDDIVDILKSVKGSTAILARTNAEVNQLAHDLDNEHISFDINTTDKHTEYILRSIVDNGFCAEYLSSLLDSEQYLQYIKNLYIDKPEDVLSYLIINYGGGYLKYTYDRIMRFRRDIEDNFKVKTPVQICKWLICQFCNSYDGVPICGDTINSIVNTAIEELDKISKNNNDVYIGTIHSVKGLEYDNVIVVGVGGQNFRIKDEEMCNLFYVACTRAKSNLYLFIDDCGIPANLKWLFAFALNRYLDYEDTY